MTTPLLKLTGINKSFGPIDVLHDISLEVYRGEVLCLLGDNGAGKSTLIKILSGVHKPTSGSLEMNGKPVAFDSPRDASAAGIATVHQFGGTFPLMSIGRSFFVGAEPTKRWGPFAIFDRTKANEIAVRETRQLGITRIDDGNRLVGGLSGGERQALAHCPAGAPERHRSHLHHPPGRSRPDCRGPLCGFDSGRQGSRLPQG
jgi:simple sugar transport system ATP-binding protein